ncbi:hypothetical protein [Achromobacter mucicolens]|jgi:hypothetical protein|uniref:hypothetical protein n=1 Tax=Achromobacter mucicolens TaxID=1389922 RepID=UPI002431E35D|nr:hypothetical protein [Achromobacter mucicolens]
MAKLGRPEVLVVGMAIACAVASIAVAYWKNWPPAAEFGTKGEWVGALASFAAALTAIAIAFWSHRRTKIESMTEGAFEIVAADHVIRQVTARTELFKVERTSYAELAADLDGRFSRFEQQLEAAQMDADRPDELIYSLNTQFGLLSDKQMAESAKAISDFSGHMEYLQSQMATLSHVKMAAFDAEVGLAVVKIKALLLRNKGLADRYSEDFMSNEDIARMAATSPALRECLDEILEHLGIIEAAVPAAERHIKRIADGH